MLNLGHPHHYQGLLRAKFEKAARRTSRNAPKVFKNPQDFANHVIRACNSGVLLHLAVTEALGIGNKTKKIHQTLRSLRPSQIDETCRKILDVHKSDRWRYYEITHEDRPEKQENGASVRRLVM